MAERYLPPSVAELVESAGRRPVAWAEERIRRDGRRFYAVSKETRLRELLRDARDPDARRKLTNLASAEASRKKKQFIQERSFQALRRLCTAHRTLARAVGVLVAANERQRKENLRIAALLAAATVNPMSSLPHSPATTAATHQSPMIDLPNESEAANLDMPKIENDHDVGNFADFGNLDAERFLID